MGVTDMNNHLNSPLIEHLLKHESSWHKSLSRSTWCDSLMKTYQIEPLALVTLVEETLIEGLV